MKKTYFLSFSVLILLLSQFFAEAKIFMGEKISVEEPPEEEVFFIGDEIKVISILKSEFIGLGRNISIFTDIKGDFIAIGYNVNFSGNAEKDIYIIGANITVEGMSKGSITVLGKNVKIKGNIKGNLRVSAENVTIEGEVEDKTILWGKDITLSGIFNDLSIYGTYFHFTPGTIIKGNLTYSTPENVDISNLTVYGKTNWKKPINEQMKEKLPLKALRRFYGFFSLLIPVLLTLFFFPNLFRQTVDISGRKFIPSFFGGLFTIITTLLFILISFITIIGVPLGLIITVFFSSLIYISRVFPAIFVGRKIFFKMQDKTSTWILSTLIGILLFTTISLHPTAKILINIICIPAGFGALFAGRIKLIKRLRDEKIL
ncbi:MAG: FapA family protein [Candidatus Omnitrophica bacterium]|nr:FapA family protein [Candidatus Omnitrophota bacterium]